MCVYVAVAVIAITIVVEKSNNDEQLHMYCLQPSLCSVPKQIFNELSKRSSEQTKWFPCFQCLTVRLYCSFKLLVGILWNGEQAEKKKKGGGVEMRTTDHVPSDDKQEYRQYEVPAYIVSSIIAFTTS